MSLKIVFAGTPLFAIPALVALLESEHSVCAVYTKPDRPAGRGQKLTKSPIKQFAEQHNLLIHQPETLKDKIVQQTLKELQADIMVDVAYGLFLPKEVLDLFKFGCINIHPSMLPRWRGAAPIGRAILVGDKETGVTIMQVDEGWDTGAILKQIKAPINDTDTTENLQKTLSQIGAELLLEVLRDIEANKLKPIEQDDSKSCYAEKIKKSEAELNWQLSAIELDRMVRAFNPWPVAFTYIDNQLIRIWKTIPLTIKTQEPPGTIINATKEGIDVATGKGILRLLELQLAGGKILTVAAILNSKRDLFKVGNRFHA